MNAYAGNLDALRALVREAEVHRDLYVNEDVFQLEMEHVFAASWIFVGHESQIPAIGDFYSTTIGLQPVVMVRAGEDDIRVHYNRCPHKGVKLVGETCGNAGKFFRCPYHAWVFRLEGPSLGMPLRQGYENVGFAGMQAAQGLSSVKQVRNYRGFVFARLSEHGPDFEEFFGDSLSSIDNMVDRSPAGRLEVAGPPLRYMHNCNWKMLVENQTDTCHPMVAHESSAGTAKEVWQKAAPGTPKPMAVEIFLPFVSPYEFFEKMGIRVWDNGHAHTGVSTSIHANYSAIPGYFEKMVAAYGGARQGDPRREPPQHRLFPQHDDQGADPASAPVQADLGRAHAGGILDLPPRRRARSPAGAHADVQPPHQRADLRRRS